MKIDTSVGVEPWQIYPINRCLPTQRCTTEEGSPYPPAAAPERRSEGEGANTHADGDQEGLREMVAIHAACEVRKRQKHVVSIRAETSGESAHSYMGAQDIRYNFFSFVKHVHPIKNYFYLS
jgi:hypothetical protein